MPDTTDRNQRLRNTYSIANNAYSIAKAALRSYELGEYRLFPLAESFNTVVRVDTRAARFVLRIGPQLSIHPTGAAALEDRWTRDLAARGLHVPRIVPTMGGKSSVRVAVRGEPGRRDCTVLTWQPGRTPESRLTAEDIADLARLSASLHDASPALARQPPGSLTMRSALHFDLDDRLDELSRPDRDVLSAARDRAQTAIDELWRAADTHPRLIHSDLTPANVVRDDDALLPIDFQDASWGHIEQDLAHSIYGVTRGIDLGHAVDTFRLAYEQIRQWPPALDVELLVDLTAARRIAMVNLAVHRGRLDLDAYAARHADALRRW